MGHVDLYWIPLGAGGTVVRRCGRWFEAVAARRERRSPCQLFHAALVIRADGVDHTLEQAPVWNNPAPDRGVVAEGPVGARWLGRWRLFRYEIRCWPGGEIPDLDEAVGGARRLSASDTQAREVLEAVHLAPTATWGRDELGAGEMWNSNSLIAWVLVMSGHEVAQLHPPDGGRAPGWAAGVAVATRPAPGGPHP